MRGKFIRSFSTWCLLVALGNVAHAQETPDLRVVVNMVQLNVAVTDKNGNYLSGLQLKDFAVTEDGISQQVATFGEGNEMVRSRARVD